MEEQKPSGFENYLSEFGPVLFDSYCGEPVAWGFRIIQYLGDEIFRELGKFGHLECLDGATSSWALVTKTLSRDEAVELYGTITHEELGPRGGWRSTTFGGKIFISKFLRPKK